jgi:phosphate uptake regulator
MELRKIQKTGGTFFVSLPHDWAQKNGVDKGSLVSVIEAENGRLLIDPKYELKKNIEVAEVAPSSYLKREIVEKYLLGFDIIKIEGRTRLPPETNEEVRKTIQGLIGLEIVEEDVNRIVLQFLLEPALFTPDKILRREYLFASSMHMDVTTALLEKNINLADAILKRDDEVDRLYFLLIRLLRTMILNPRLSEKMDLSLIDCLDYRMIATYVEAIGDYASQIARDIIEFFHVTVSSDILHFIKQASDAAYNMHKNAIQALISRTYDSIDAVAKKNLEVQTYLNEIKKLSVGVQPDESAFVSSISFSLRRICDASIDISDIVLPR